MGYSFKEVEKKWQAYWAKHNTFKADTKLQNKCYVLEMLPYPSGNLHVGHVRNYTIGDTIARFKRMCGFNVLYPMGWDAFGLPAENAAIENNTAPSTWTHENIARMRDQLKQLGFSYDWEREIDTSSVDYYKHEQRFFIELYKKGLLYQSESWVNWDPVEHTVLANEQVIDGKGWRSGAVVERKKLTQWFLAITAYSEELLEGLKTLKNWPEKVVKMQENWIGRSEGIHITFKVDGLASEKIEVFTTKPETLFGASFLALSPEHPFIQKCIATNTAVSNFAQEYMQTSTSEKDTQTLTKKGVFTGFYVLHPFDESVKLPIFAANFVLMNYGTGAVFACPAHDERDYEFAKKYNMPIRPVVACDTLPFTDFDHDIMVNSDFLNGLTVPEAKERMMQELEKMKIGKRTVQYRLRDWGISRQRYWGCPIPMVKCKQCGVVPEVDLPVCLPQDVAFSKAGNPLENHATWKNTLCPKCKGAAKRETDTLDTFFESSWYFMRYCCPHSKKPLDKNLVNFWMPVDVYIGGIEHAVLHLLYARFFTKALRDLGYCKVDEPFTKLITQGMVLHKTYKDRFGKWISPDSLTKGPDGKYYYQDYEVIEGPYEKMSKSKKNTVDPQRIIDAYGVDSIRLFILSDAPPEKDFEWNENGLDGCWRYLNRFYKLMSTVHKHECLDGSDELLKIAHQYLETIKKDYERHAFNKVISHHRELTAKIEKLYTQSSHLQEIVGISIKIIAPIVPHIASELLQMNAQEKNVGSWPQVNDDLTLKDVITMVVQVNGKKRGVFDVQKDASDEDIKEAALELAQKYMEEKPIKKTIIVPGRMVSFVV